MGLYGPFTATAGTVQRCEVDQDAAALYIVNTSRYDLNLAFEAQNPGATTAFGGPPWLFVVPSGDRRGVRIPTSVYGANGFPGYVWVLPIDNTNVLAQSGTVSGNVKFSIETYPDVNALPPDYASPQRQDASSQQRVIALPYGAVSRATETRVINATGLQAEYTLAGIAGIPLNPNAPGSPGGFDWVMYLHWIAMFTDGQTYNVHISGISYDTAGGAQFGGSVAEVIRARVTPTTPFVLPFYVTPELSFQLVSNTATIKAQLYVDSLSAAGGNLIFTSNWTVDYLTGTTVPPIGAGSSTGFTGQELY